MPVLSSDDQLAQLWSSGASLTDIGVRLGESRGVVAGRIESTSASRSVVTRCAAR